MLSDATANIFRFDSVAKCLSCLLEGLGLILRSNKKHIKNKTFYGWELKLGLPELKLSIINQYYVLGDPSPPTGGAFTKSLYFESLKSQKVSYSSLNCTYLKSLMD